MKSGFIIFIEKFLYSEIDKRSTGLIILASSPQKRGTSIYNDEIINTFNTVNKLFTLN